MGLWPKKKNKQPQPLKLDINNYTYLIGKRFRNADQREWQAEFMITMLVNIPSVNGEERIAAYGGHFGVALEDLLNPEKYVEVK